MAHDFVMIHTRDRMKIAVSSRPEASPISNRMFESVRDSAVSKIDMIFGQIL